MTSALLDLGVADVHSPGAGHFKKGPATAPRKTAMAEISGADRKALPDSAFALPKTRAYPIHDKAHATNALARLEQNKTSLKPGEYASAKRRIQAAERKFGVKAQQRPIRGSSRGLRLRFDGANGSFQIAHMSDSDPALCRLFTPLESNAAGAPGSTEPVWIQLAKFGRFNGHPAGPFQFDQDAFSAIVRNFTDIDGGEIAFDFEHASELKANEGSVPTQGAPAQGWIRRLEVRPGGLWGLVDWLEPARSYIREKKYKYVSPAVRWKAVHPVSGQDIGPRLSSAALTNKPFLRSMAPVTATDTGGVQSMSLTMLGSYAYSSNEYMPKLRTALRCNDMASASECGDTLEKLCEMYRASNGADMVHGIPIGDCVRALGGAIGAPMHMSVEDIFAAVAELLEEAMAELEGGGMGMPEASASDANMSEATEGDEGLLGEPPAAETALADTTNQGGASATNGETEMADKDIATLMSQIAAVETEKATLLSQNATLTLRLADAESSRDANAAELTLLRDAQKARDARDIDARVDAAFETYRDKMKLTEPHKKAMRIVLCSDAATFESIYPPVRAAERHLMSMHAARPGADIGPPTGEGMADVKIDLAALARQVSQEKGMSIADAQAFVLRSQRH